MKYLPLLSLAGLATARHHAHHRRSPQRSGMLPSGLNGNKLAALPSSCMRPPVVGSTIIVPEMQPIVVKSGEVFDGKNQMYQYANSACNINVEVKGLNAAPFVIQPGGTLMNVHLGLSQEQIHCMGSCNITNVHAHQLCDETVSLQGDGTSYITSSSFSHGANKGIQVDGDQTVYVNNVCFDDLNIGIATCGNCRKENAVTKGRHFVLKNIIANDVHQVSTCNENYHDTVTITGLTGNYRSSCDSFIGNSVGAQPKKIGIDMASSCCLISNLNSQHSRGPSTPFAGHLGGGQQPVTPDDSPSTITPVTNTPPTQTASPATKIPPTQSGKQSGTTPPKQPSAPAGKTPPTRSGKPGGGSPPTQPIAPTGTTPTTQAGKQQPSQGDGDNCD
ncbi:polysaccharide lyase family 3 protein [Mixia osmundae IAM 14324]|uniref:Pectate lyase n=1 Tax=Mixia osmundae (strain CBS 9802 / IAM 14324 / JCM 22182 / KY 12970) TaxID=764103 RepID=G7DX08_MIXOS|nr:polysaccharide lyase family 3 protein [Mixia osmundae IAM 14324]KEI38086.1 polysaccharide lyase family 3 protein [Mixia osmundae IAM 14324]GAA95105.1 hypothetical protein E5Q_01760 [Mixia osmundae IAM 14324]